MDDSNTSKSNSSTCMDQSFTEPVLLGTTGSFVRASLICILIIAALIANIFVCLAVYKQRSARRITRYFIVNLCVADVFVTGISMPIWLVFLLYDNKSAYCLLGETFIVIWTHVDILCGTASILSLTSISVDRYIAVTKPYSYVRFMTGKRALHVIGGIWIYSMTVALLLKPLRKFDGGKWQLRVWVEFQFNTESIFGRASVSLIVGRKFCAAGRSQSEKEIKSTVTCSLVSFSASHPLPRTLALEPSATFCE